VVADFVTIGCSYAFYLQPVVDLGLARDRHALSVGEDCTDLEDTPRPLLAEIAVAGHYSDRFVLNRDVDLPTSAFGSSRHDSIVHIDQYGRATLRQISLRAPEQ
jgi:hypothetical protein